MRTAAELGDGLFATEATPDLIAGYKDAGGGAGPCYAEVSLSWAPTEEAALASAHKLFRFSAAGWKVQAELPNPVNFEAASSVVRESDIADSFGYGPPDAGRHLEKIRTYADAGFDHLALVNAGAGCRRVLPLLFGRARTGPVRRRLTDGFCAPTSPARSHRPDMSSELRHFGILQVTDRSFP